MGSVTTNNPCTSFPNYVAGDGQRQKMVCMNQIGQPFQKHPKSAMSWYHASAKRDV